MHVIDFREKIGARINAAQSRLLGRFARLPVRLKSTGGDQWEATGGDPQFVFPTPPPEATALYIWLDARPNYIKPRVYVDWGDGFNEFESVDVGDAEIALIRINLDGARGLKNLRLDPSEGPSTFKLLQDFESAGKTVAAEFRRLASEAKAASATVVEIEIDATDYAPAAVGRPIGLKRLPRDIHDNFLRAAEVARRDIGAAVPAPEADGVPLISFVVPVYNTPDAYLNDLLASFRAQTPGLAELVLSDDASPSPQTQAWLDAHARDSGVVVVRNAQNGGIAAASNEGIQAARGKWIGLVDHDDAIAPHAVALLARVIWQNPALKFVYTDELIVDKNMHGIDMFIKPAFDDVLLSGVNYINHLSLYRRDLLNEMGGFRAGFDGSQDYDLLLRYLGKLHPSEVRHLPYPAYLWRRDGASYSVKFLEKATVNARRALSEAYTSEEDGAPSVDPAMLGDLHRVRFDTAMAKPPKVSIVIPNKNSFALMSRLLEGLLHNTDYPDLEIIIIDNGTTDPAVLALYDKVRAERSNFVLVLEVAKFNFSRQVNRGMKLASGELVLLLNNDIEILEPHWLKEMVGCFRYPRTGVVGARLLYPNRTIQHAGVIVGLGGLAGHWYIQKPADFVGPMARLSVRSTMSAVTGACMLISRECLEKVGLFDETNFAIAYNDIDFCMRAREAGLRVVYTPFAKLVHHESVSRGRDDRGPNRPRFLRDQAALLERHGTEDFIDPAYSPWYDRDHSEPRVITLEKLPAAR